MRLAGICHRQIAWRDGASTQAVSGAKLVEQLRLATAYWPVAFIRGNRDAARAIRLPVVISLLPQRHQPMAT